MSRDASIILDWADGTYTFALKWEQLALLQEACNAGPFVVHDRLAGRTWRIEDISSAIRLGLMGGGTPADKALKLTRDYVESRPPLENIATARSIVAAGIIGAPDEKPGEAEGEATGSGLTTSPTESSASA